MFLLIKMNRCLFFILITGSLACQAQNFKSRFTELVGRNDTAAQIRLLKQWRISNPNDAELYVAYFNYYAKSGLIEVLTLTRDKPDGEALQLKDKNNQTAGYLGGTHHYNDALIKQGFDYIDTGISKFPSRLDMRFGKVYVYGRVEDYKDFTKEIIIAVEDGQRMSNKWTWTDNKPLDEPVKFMLSTIQAYVVQLFNVGDNQSENMRQIVQAVLKYHPDNVECLSDLSIVYITNKEYPKALETLLKAQKSAPQDPVVLNNIAYCYELQGKKTDAIKYYELVLQFGDDAEKEKAGNKIAELKK